MMVVKKYFAFLALIFVISCNSRSTTQTTSVENNDSTAATTDSVQTKKILFFGNSLTAGYGLADQHEAFPAIIQEKIDSLGLPYQCINAGLSGETSAGGNERIDWLLKQPIDVFVLELGANDGLRGVSPDATYKNLSSIVEKVLKANPDCKLVLAGMKVPPNMGNAYFKEFEAIFPRLAKDYDMHLIPFLLDRVAGIADLNQADGIHPTTAGQRIMAENTWNILQPLL